MATAQPRLHRAAARGEKVKLKQFLTAGDDVNARDTAGRTALLEAVVCGQFNCVKLLLAAGADPSTSDNATYFPLHVAAEKKNIAIATALIRANADIDAICYRPYGATALSMAASRGDQAIVRLLLDAGSDTSITAADGYHPLTYASIYGHADVVKMLLDAGADVSSMSAEGLTALLAGAQTGCCDVIKILLERGADVNQPNLKGTTALHAATLEGFDEVLNVLITTGATVDCADNQSRTPLHASALHGHPKCAWALLRAGANVSATDHRGSTPLHIAAFGGFTDVIEVLLSGGAHADVNLEDKDFRTPLIAASAFADVRAVNLLLDAGADINQRDANRATALFRPSDVKIVKALLDRGADAEALNKIGWTVLHGAGSRGACAGVICALFKAGADPTQKDVNAETAADVARSDGHEDAAKLLDLLAAKYRSVNSTMPAASGNEGEEKRGDA